MLWFIQIGHDGHRDKSGGGEGVVFFFLKAIWEWTQAGGSFTDWQEENGVISEDAGL